MSKFGSDSAEGQYQGSQAFAHVVPGRDESINPNTGSLNFRKSLIQLRGITSSADFTLSLSYTIGSAGVFGLPPNWSFNLPCVVPEKSITFSGRTYAIDKFWSDAEGHKSGLKYMNNHGIKFCPIVPPQPLPNGQPGEYAYKLQLQDGSADYFDALGRPLAHQDIFGNSLQYFYLEGQRGGVLTSEPCLDYILDSWGQRIQFGYQPGLEMVVTGPANAQTSIHFSSVGIDLIADPFGFKTSFTYGAAVTDQQVLSTISYATGLTSRFDYTAIEYLDKDNATRHMPAVSDHYHQDSQGQILKHTNYRFGSLSGGLTFTGISIGCQLSGLKDDLMDGRDGGYRYDVLITNYDETGEIVSATLNWFNHLHLPVSECNYLVIGQDDLVEAYQTTYAYNIDPDQHARTTNYAQPAVVQYSHNTANGGQSNWQSLRRSTMSYNAYGELTSQEQEICIGGSTYVKTKTLTKDYYTTGLKTQGLKIQRLKSETVTDIAGGTVQETQNVLSADEKTVKSSTVYFKAPSDEGKKPWKVRSQEYDSHGRVVEEKTAWADKAPVPDGSARIYVSSTAFTYRDGVLMESRSDSSTGATLTYYDMRISGGPIVQKVLSLGQSEKFEYDIIGRPIRQIDALGGITTIFYTVNALSNTETVRNPQGFTHQTTFDVLGRPIKQADNGDPTQSLTEPTRVLKRVTYDTLGQLKSTKDSLDLSTMYTFDALGRPLGVTDPVGNVVYNIYDDMQLTVKQTLNGDLRKESKMDGYGRIVHQTIHADSGDKSITCCLVQETVYDGNSQKVKESFYQQPTKGGQPSNRAFKTQITTYDADSRINSQITIGAGDAGEDVVTRNFVYDIYGNRHTWTKETSYSDGRTFIRRGPITLYDMRGNLTLLRNQLGHEERNTYNENGWLTSTTRFDGTVVTFAYDACGQSIQRSTKAGTTDITYKFRGQVESIKHEDSKMTFEYFSDGLVRSVDYGDGYIQNYERDQISRVIAEIDVFGTKKETKYDQFGRLASIACQGDFMLFQYGTVYHQAGTLVGYSLTGKRQYIQKIEYDGFHERSKVYTLKPDSTVLLETSYTRNNRRQVASINSTSMAQPELNRTYTWLYDGIGQLIEEMITSAAESKVVQKFTYDGNSNVLSFAINGQTTDMIYNEIDQRIDVGFEYDQNGRLVRDNTGLQYTFDELDHLLAVQGGSGRQTQFEYHSDDSLATLIRSREKTEFFYTRDRQINAISYAKDDQANSTSSLIRNEDKIIASYSASAHPTYFFERHGSTAMQLTDDESTAINYRAYGSLTSTSPLKPQSSFAFGQELVDPLSGLVYLRSRFYQPDHMAFISMDSYLLENRYAYCQGDPINYCDPSGHLSLRTISTIAIGAIGGAIVSIATFGGATPLVTAGLMGIGVSEAALATTTGVAVTEALAGSLAGVTGNVVGNIFSQVTNVTFGGSWEYGLSDVGQDIVTGAVGGSVAGGIGRFVAGGIGRAARPRYITDVVAAFADLSIQTGISHFAYGDPIENYDTWVNFGLNLAVGYAISRTAALRSRRLQYEAAVRQVGERYRGTRLVMEMVQLNQAVSSFMPQTDGLRLSSSLWADIREGCKDALGDWWRYDNNHGPGDGGGGLALPLLGV